MTSQHSKKGAHVIIVGEPLVRETSQDLEAGRKCGMRVSFSYGLLSLLNNDDDHGDGDGCVGEDDGEGCVGVIVIALLLWRSCW